MTGPRSANRCLPALLILALLLAAGSGARSAGAAEPEYRPDVEHYLHKYLTEKQERFILDEIKRYRSYPRLDRAYRLQRSGRLAEARSEFEAYLTLVPEDLRTRVSFLALLERMGRYREEIAQADLILSRHPAFVPATLYKAQALRKLGETEQAYRILARVAGEKELRREDRLFALSSAADLAYARKDYPEAARMVLALAEVEKSHARFLEAGTLLEKADRPREALDAYDAAVREARTPVERVAAALAAAELARKQKLPERARRSYETVLADAPGNRAALRALADEAYLARRYREAEKWMVQLLEHHAATAPDRLFLANLYLLRDARSEAAVQLKAAVELQGEKATAEDLAELAQAHEDSGDLRESVAAYRALLLRFPERAEAQLRYGSLLNRMQRYGEAVHPLTKALSLNLPPARKGVAHRNLALALEKTRKYREAARELEKSLPYRNGIGEGELLVRIGRLFNRAGQPSDALSVLDRALALPSLSDELKRLAHGEKSAAFEISGDSPAAAAELERALAGAQGDPEAMVRLAVLQVKAGKSAEGLKNLDAALALPTLPEDLKRTVYREKAVLLEKGGRPLEAAQQYEKLAALGEKSPVLSVTLGNLYLSGEKPEQAAVWFEKVLGDPEAGRNEVCSAADGLSYSVLKLERLKEAEETLASAVRLCGENRQRRYYLGIVYYRQKQWEKALEQFTVADRERRDRATLVQIALCHKELERPGAAIHYLLAAKKEPGEATAEEMRQTDATLGYLYAEEHAYDQAAESFTRALAQGADPVLRLKLATVLDLSGKSSEGLAALDGIAVPRLSSTEQKEYRDLKASLLGALGRNDEALALLEENRALDPSAERCHGLGVAYLQAGRKREAIEQFESACRKEPDSDRYLLALAYGYLSDDRLDDAGSLLEKVAARTPEDPRVREELGYLNARAGRNERSSRWFAEALERLPELPEDGSDEYLRREEDAYRLRGELAKLNRSFRGTVYASYRAGKAQQTFVANGGQSVAGLNGDLGVEAAYRPARFGLVNDRIFEIFGRVFGDLKTDTVQYRESSTQAGAGLRYKFLSRENLWISGERLLGIGRDGVDDWLLRLLYSRGKGMEPQPSGRSADYYLVYGELDGYLRGETFAAYAELRKGRSFTVAPRWLIAPHLLADVRWQTATSPGGKYAEGGAGISLKHFFRGTPLENYGTVFDLSANYKHGVFYGRGTGGDHRNYDSAVVSIGLFF